MKFTKDFVKISYYICVVAADEGWYQMIFCVATVLPKNSKLGKKFKYFQISSLGYYESVFLNKNQFFETLSQNF